MNDIIPFQNARPTRQLQQQSYVLIVAQDGPTRDGLVAGANMAGHDVTVTGDLDEAVRRLSQTGIDVCLVDLDKAGDGVQAFCQTSTSWRHSTSLLGVASLELIASAGFKFPPEFELIPKPYSPERLRFRLSESTARHRLLKENVRLRQRFIQRLHDELVGHSEAIETLRRRIQAAAESDDPVLVLGEPGTGTTLVARAVHLSSGRSDGRLTTVDCRLQTTACLEQALFGHEASHLITGPARLDQAAGGTLVIDNIDAASLPLQKKLADFFTTPVAPGRDRWRDRIVAVSHSELQRRVEEGLFHAGLFDSLRQHTVTVPPLRERREDIVPLAEHLLHRLAAQEGQAGMCLAPDAQHLLTAFHWPGNVSQLWNVIHRAGLLERGETLTAEMLRPWIEDETTGDRGIACGLTLREMERKLIETTFNRCHGNRERTAQALKIGLRTLSGKLREYGYPPRGGPGSNLRTTQRKAA